jgi:hypothetical protein
VNCNSADRRNAGQNRLTVDLPVTLPRMPAAQHVSLPHWSVLLNYAAGKHAVLVQQTCWQACLRCLLFQGPAGSVGTSTTSAAGRSPCALQCLLRPFDGRQRCPSGESDCRMRHTPCSNAYATMQMHPMQATLYSWHAPAAVV